MRILFRVLKGEEDARVALPSPEEVAEYQDVVETNYPALPRVWCVMDGLKIKIEKVWMRLHKTLLTMGGCMPTLLVVFMFLLLLG